MILSTGVFSTGNRKSEKVNAGGKKSILPEGGFSSFLSEEASRLSDFRRQNPGSDQAVYRGSRDESGLLTEKGESYFAQMQLSVEEHQKNAGRQMAAGLSFMEELKESLEKREEAASKREDPVQKGSKTAGKAAETEAEK